MLSFDLLEKNDNIFHFITTRQGGVSRGNYASFNLSEYTGDPSENVAHNRRLLCEAININPEHLFLPCQTHGSEILVIDKDFLSCDKQEQKAFLQGKDALITDRPGICIGITTADCVPVLLYDCRKNVIAAVHAGWRGTVNRIVSHCVQTMCKKYSCLPENILAGIGPSISLNRFEVGQEVPEAFLKAGYHPETVIWENRETGKIHIDLWEANKQDLLQAGITAPHIEISNICSRSLCDSFFSARHLGIKSGRMVSGIFLRNRTETAEK